MAVWKQLNVSGLYWCPVLVPYFDKHTAVGTYCTLLSRKWLFLPRCPEEHPVNGEKPGIVRTFMLCICYVCHDAAEGFAQISQIHKLDL